jgi:GNAT superfamily N-acetyltransferase
LLGESLGGALKEQLTPGVAAFRAHVDDVVGVQDDVEVVLDDDDRGAVVDEALEHADELVDVGEVEARCGLVEHVDRRGASAAQLFRQLHPLGLSPGHRRRGLAEADVAQADVLELAQRAGQGSVFAEDLQGLIDAQIQGVGDGEARPARL